MTVRTALTHLELRMALAHNILILCDLLERPAGLKAEKVSCHPKRHGGKRNRLCSESSGWRHRQAALRLCPPARSETQSEEECCRSTGTAQLCQFKKLFSATVTAALKGGKQSLLRNLVLLVDVRPKSDQQRDSILVSFPSSVVQRRRSMLGIARSVTQRELDDEFVTGLHCLLH
jgi:hypothetical protein